MCGNNKHPMQRILGRWTDRIYSNRQRNRQPLVLPGQKPRDDLSIWNRHQLTESRGNTVLTHPLASYPFGIPLQMHTPVIRRRRTILTRRIRHRDQTRRHLGFSELRGRSWDSSSEPSTYDACCAVAMSIVRRSIGMLFREVVDEVVARRECVKGVLLPCPGRSRARSTLYQLLYQGHAPLYGQ